MQSEGERERESSGDHGGCTVFCVDVVESEHQMETNSMRNIIIMRNIILILIHLVFWYPGLDGT